MKYSKRQRLAIGKRIYDGEITTNIAAVEYDINYYTARDYLRLYKSELKQGNIEEKKKSDEEFDMQDYYNMSRDDLIEELIKSKINEERAKKGYIVKGDGRNKQFLVSNKQS